MFTFRATAVALCENEATHISNMTYMFEPSILVWKERENGWGGGIYYIHPLIPC